MDKEKKDIRKILNDNLNNLEVLKKEKHIFSDKENVTKRAAKIRSNVVNYLETYLRDFESYFQRNGGFLVWTKDKKESQNEILKILTKHKADKISLYSELLSIELGLNKFLKEKGQDIFEYNDAVSFLEDKDILPAHLQHFLIDREENELIEFLKFKHYKEDLSNEEIIQYVNDYKSKFSKKSKVGIIEADFLVSETGSIVVSSSDRHKANIITNSDVIIVIAGIEDVLVSLNDVELMISLKYEANFKEKSPHNINIIHPDQEDKKKEMYVILVDNGRTNLLALEDIRESLRCIKCGACYSTCSIYSQIGNIPYKSLLAGPIGVIKNMHIDIDTYLFQNNYCNLCGKCNTVCPVNINFKRINILNRKYIVENKLHEKNQRKAINYYKRFVSKRKSMDRFNPLIKKQVIKYFYNKNWGEEKAFPKFANKTFSQQYVEKKNIK